MYFLYKNEYRIFKSVNHHKKGTKVEKKNREAKPIGVIIHIYTEKSQ
jgi:hypothetical protein